MAWYWCKIAWAGSCRIRRKSSTLRSVNWTRIGKRPCNSGIKSEGLATWKAPEPIKRIWSVEIMPYLVWTSLPSTIGKMSRWTPWRLTSPPWLEEVAILSISSMKIMPLFWANSKACWLISSWLTRWSDSSSVSNSRASLTVTLRLIFFLGRKFWNSDWTSIICSIIGFKLLSCSFFSSNSMVTSLSLSKPWRNCSLIWRRLTLMSSVTTSWGSSWLWVIFCNMAIKSLGWACCFFSCLIPGLRALARRVKARS